MSREAKGSQTGRGINCVSMQRSGETFVFLFGDSKIDRVLIERAIGKAAADPELVFDWRDAGKCTAGVLRLTGR